MDRQGDRSLFLTHISANTCGCLRRRGLLVKGGYSSEQVGILGRSPCPLRAGLPGSARVSGAGSLASPLIEAGSSLQVGGATRSAQLKPSGCDFFPGQQLLGTSFKITLGRDPGSHSAPTSPSLLPLHLFCWGFKPSPHLPTSMAPSLDLPNC